MITARKFLIPQLKVVVCSYLGLENEVAFASLVSPPSLDKKRPHKEIPWRGLLRIIT